MVRKITVLLSFSLIFVIAACDSGSIQENNFDQRIGEQTEARADTAESYLANPEAHGFVEVSNVEVLMQFENITVQNAGSKAGKAAFQDLFETSVVYTSSNGDTVIVKRRDAMSKNTSTYEYYLNPTNCQCDGLVYNATWGNIDDSCFVGQYQTKDLRTAYDEGLFDAYTLSGNVLIRYNPNSGKMVATGDTGQATCAGSSYCESMVREDQRAPQFGAQQTVFDK